MDAAGAADALAWREVYDAIHKCRFRFLYGPEQAFVDMANATFPGPPLLDRHDAAGRALVERVRGQLHAWLWFQHPPDEEEAAVSIACVAHEALHAVAGVYAGIGQEQPVRLDDETTCYFLEWVVRETIRALTAMETQRWAGPTQLALPDLPPE